MTNTFIFYYVEINFIALQFNGFNSFSSKWVDSGHVLSNA